MTKIKIREVISYYDDSEPVFVTIMKASETRMNDTLYHLIIEQPDSCEFKTLSKKEIREEPGFQPEHIEEILISLEEIEDEET